VQSAKARARGAARLLRQLDEEGGDADGKLSFSEFDGYFAQKVTEARAFELQVWIADRGFTGAAPARSSTLHMVV
jgi:hypothetical protein